MNHFFQFPLVLGPRGTGVAQEFRLEAQEPRFERFGHGCLLGQKVRMSCGVNRRHKKTPGETRGDGWKTAWAWWAGQAGWAA